MGVRWTHTDKKHHNRPAGRLLGEFILLLVRSLLWVGFTAAGTALNMWAAVVLLLLFTPSNFWGYLAAGFGTAIAGGVGGGIIGFGQVLALRRWLDTPASLGSFFSTVLASSSALLASTLTGWWMHAVAGDLAGALAGVVVYGLVFGLIQRPMLDYMSRYSVLWVPVNTVAAVLGTMTVLAAFDISGGRRDMLQFRYAGLVYSLVVGIALLWMTRETRRTMSNWREIHREINVAPRADAGSVPYSIQGSDNVWPGPALLETNECRAYEEHQALGDSITDQRHNAYETQHLANKSDAASEDWENGSDIIEGTYTVIP